MGQHKCRAAAESFRRSNEIRANVIASSTGNQIYTGVLACGWLETAEALAGEGDFGEAIEALDRACVAFESLRKLRPNDDRLRTHFPVASSLRCRSLVILARESDVGRELDRLASLRWASAQRPGPHRAVIRNLAAATEARARAHNSHVDDHLSQALTTETVSWIRAAYKAGQFRSASDLAFLFQERLLDQFRGRSDFDNIRAGVVRDLDRAMPNGWEAFAR
jgi:hypothetical protein